MAVWIYVVLWIDGLALGPARGKLVQHAMGVVTFAVLLAVARLSPPAERRDMWFCVAWSTLVEIVATQAWGLYGYRLGNVPLYVPPGHGLIFLVALQGSRAAWVHAHARTLGRAAIVVATAWAAWGLLADPARRDVHGALYWPFFVAFLWRSEKAAVWTITFAVTSFIEIVGVRFGTWHWSAIMPGLGIPSGDPPTLIAGGYCSFALVATALASAFARAKPAEEGDAVRADAT